MDSGEARLKALGYKQELKRDFTLVSNTAISFSIISTLLGITGFRKAPLPTHESSLHQYPHIVLTLHSEFCTPLSSLTR